MVAGHQHPGEIDLATSDVAVDIDAAGHDDLAGQIEGAIDARAGARIGDDAPVLDEEIGRDAIAAVGGIDDEAAGALGERHDAVPFPRSCASSIARAAPTAGAAASR